MTIHIKYISNELQAIDPIPVEFDAANTCAFKKGAISATACGVFNCVRMTRTDCVERLREILAEYFHYFDELTVPNEIQHLKMSFIRKFVMRTPNQPRRWRKNGKRTDGRN